jgi:cysteine desulfurase
MFSFIHHFLGTNKQRSRQVSEVGGGQRVYLDHAAATPMFPVVREAMLPYFVDVYGNASAIHSEGRRIRAVVEDARQTVARVLGIQPSGVTFTSGGTEGNNLAIRGVVEARRQAGVPYAQMEIVTTSIEHPATLRTVESLASLGVMVQYVDVDENGYIKLAHLRELVSAQTVLVCVTYINSEIGTIERVAQLKRTMVQMGSKALLYVDAAQAPLWVPCQPSRLRADIMTFDGGKCGGPQGVGVLATYKGVELVPYAYGGGQERGLRPGTEPTSLVVGMARALELAQGDYEARTLRVRAVRDQILAELQRRIPQAMLNGATGEDRAPNNINISIPGIDSEYAVVVLDTHGVAVSTKSACSSAGGGESVVVKAVTHDAARATSTLRITLGPDTTMADMYKCIDALALYLDKFHIKSHSTEK